MAIIDAVFGECTKKLQPLSQDDKEKWRQGIKRLLTYSDADHPNLKSNLPKLRQLNEQLILILEAFRNFEFDGSTLASIRRLKMYKLYLCDIVRDSRSVQERCLLTMEVPKPYIDSLPKSGRECVGEAIYGFLTHDNVDPDLLIDYFEKYSAKGMLKTTNCLEKAAVIWNRKSVHGRRLDVLGESTIHDIKMRFPDVLRTELDSTKLQHNMDINISIVEGYSRAIARSATAVLERIEGLLEGNALPDVLR